MNFLKISQENLIKDHKKILNNFDNFYAKLYSETHRNNCKLVNKLFFSKINEKENIECKKPIAKSERFKTVSELSNNKSFGLDNFCIEFYKTFPQDLKEIFLKYFIYLLVVNQLCDS